LATKNLKDELRRLDEEEARIKDQRAKLQDQAKAQALAAAEAAIADLNALGFNYRLVDVTKSVSTSRPVARKSTGTRRTGIREEVLAAVAKAGPDGIAPAAIRAKLGIEGKAGAQSVANALSALKKANHITDKNGAYVAA
jgi:hypothetical protein